MRKNKLVGRRGRPLDDDKLKGGRDDLDVTIGVHTLLKTTIIRSYVTCSIQGNTHLHAHQEKQTNNSINKSRGPQPATFETFLNVINSTTTEYEGRRMHVNAINPLNQKR